LPAAALEVVALLLAGEDLAGEAAASSKVSTCSNKKAAT
jgi:hypothetical protein